MATTTTGRRFGVHAGLGMKAPVKAATTANVTLSGEQTIDGVALVTDDRVLVKDQTTPSENGVYIVDTSSWDRALDWDGTYDVKKGTQVYVTSGTTNRGLWAVTTDDPITIGTTSVTIARTRLQQEVLPVACSDEGSILTTGTKVTFRMPYAMLLTSVKASLTTAQTSGSIFTVDVKANGSTIFSTKITIDNGEKTTATAATPNVLSTTSLAADDEITIIIDQIGDGTATGLKVYLIGLQPGS
jgi:hypothetical protein